MSGEKVKEFESFRERMNEKILNADNKVINRFFNLDHNVYEDGALDKKTKEMMGLVGSLVLRCDDCISYHLNVCYELGLKDKELYELFSVALIVGGSILIPHLRRAVSFWEDLHIEEGANNPETIR